MVHDRLKDHLMKEILISLEGAAFRCAKLRPLVTLENHDRGFKSRFALKLKRHVLVDKEFIFMTDLSYFICQLRK